MHAHCVSGILLLNSLMGFLFSCILLSLLFWFRNLLCKLYSLFTSCGFFRLWGFRLFRNWLNCWPDLLCILNLLLLFFLGSLPIFTTNVCSKSSHFLYLYLFLYLLEVLQTVRFKFRCHLALIIPTITLKLLVLITMVSIDILKFTMLFMLILVLFDICSCGVVLCWWLTTHPT